METKYVTKFILREESHMHPNERLTFREWSSGADFDKYILI